MRSVAQAPIAIPHTDVSFLRRITRTIVQLFCYLGFCLNVWRERQQLAELDQRMLEDIGVSQSDARREAQRGYFDLPTGRLI